MPAPVLIVSIKRGGILIGAFEGDAAQGVRLLDSGGQGRTADAVVAHARRDPRRARLGPRPAPEARAARARARDGPRPDRVDLRSAAGAERASQLRRGWARSSRSTKRTSTASRAARCTADRRPIVWSRSGSCRRRTSSDGFTVRVPWSRAMRPSRRPSSSTPRASTVGCSRRQSRTFSSTTVGCWSSSRRLHRHAGSGPRARTRLAPDDEAGVSDLLLARLSRRGLLTERGSGRGQYLLQRDG